MLAFCVLQFLLINWVKSVPCVDRSIGLEGKVIPDYKMSATSEYNSDTRANYGRLNEPRHSWCSSRYPVKGKEYLQVDLGAPHVICAISTQGHPRERIWVRKYTVKVSLDGLRWEYYNEYGNEKTFVANKDKNGVVKNVLRSRVSAMFVRIYPIDYNAGNRFCLRMEIFGQRQDDCKRPINLEDKYPSGSVRHIPDSYMTASSRLNHILDAQMGRLHNRFAWCASQSSSLNPKLSLKQYLQVEFGEVLALTGLAVQGEASYGYRVSAYLLEYTIDNRTWWTYQEGGLDKIFQGPEEDGQIAVSWFKYPILARVIRINPRLWNMESICLRIEVYGCQPKDYGGVISPKVILSPVDNVKVEGEASFTCKAAGHPAPNIEWQWKDSAVPGRITMSGIIAVSKLDVYPLKRVDSGLMSCIASNGVGQKDQVQFSVDVQYAPEINRDLSTKFVHAQIGDHVVFTCEASGNPVPDIVWSTPHDLEVNSSHVTKGNILVITSVEEKDFGVYICKAKNYLGEDERSVKLIQVVVSNEGEKLKYITNGMPPFALAAICTLSYLLVLIAIVHAFVFFRKKRKKSKKNSGAITNQVYHSVCCSKPRSQEAQTQAVEMVAPQSDRLTVPLASRRGVLFQPGARSSRDISQHPQQTADRSQLPSCSEVEPYEIQTLHESRPSYNEAESQSNIGSASHTELTRANSAGYDAPSCSRTGQSTVINGDTYDVIFPLRNGTSESSSYMSLSDRMRDRNSACSDQNYQALIHKKPQVSRH